MRFMTFYGIIFYLYKDYGVVSSVDILALLKTFFILKVLE